jgi:hypothetical protein
MKCRWQARVASLADDSDLLAFGFITSIRSINDDIDEKPMDSGIG